MKNTVHWCLVMFLLLANFSYSQDSTALSNVQEYTPSKLLKKGQVDIQMFNNLYTETKGRDTDRKLFDKNVRANYFRSFVQVLVGTSKSGRVNWGADFVFSSVRINADPKSSSLLVFHFENTDFTRTAFTAFGPKIKFSPFKNNPDFSIQSALWFPIAKDSESDFLNKPWIDWNRITSWTQFFYSQNLNNKWQLFYEIDVLGRFSLPASYYQTNTAKGNLISLPSSFFVNYFSSSKSTIYGMLQYAPTFGLNSSITYDWDYFQGGIGAKYQLTKYFQVELLYSSFFMAKNNGAGRTYNVGLRYIR